MTLLFSSKETISIVKLGMLISESDNIIADEEVALILTELKRCGVEKSKQDSILEKAYNMDFSDAIPVIKSMDVAKKKHVVAFLGSLISSDGVIAEAEKKMCTLISLLCDLPLISASEAIENWLE